MANSLTDHDVAEMNRIRRKVDTLRGEGVANAHDSITIAAQAPARRGTHARDGLDPCLLVVASGNSGGFVSGSWSGCTYGYDGYAAGDTAHANKLFANQQPGNAFRPNGVSFSPATAGFYTLVNGTPTLVLAEESPSTQLCNGGSVSSS